VRGAWPVHRLKAREKLLTSANPKYAISETDSVLEVLLRELSARVVQQFAEAHSPRFELALHAAQAGVERTRDR
jgi:hypothetical protein